MRKLSKQVSVASLSVLSISALAGGNALAYGGMGSGYQNSQSSTMGAGGSQNYSTSSWASADSSNYLANSYSYSYDSGNGQPQTYSYNYTSGDGRIHNSFYSYTSGNGQGDISADINTNTNTSTDTDTNTNTNTNILQRRLDMQLRRHTMLAGQLLRLQHRQTSLRSAVENNNQALADTVSQLYPGTRDQFLQLWRNHIQYYQQYLTAAEQNDNAGLQQARQDLTNFESDMAKLFENANSQLDNANLEQRISTHINDTISYIDNLVSGVHSGRQSHSYMDMSTMMDNGSSYTQSQ